MHLFDWLCLIVLIVVKLHDQADCLIQKYGSSFWLYVHNDVCPNVLPMISKFIITVRHHIVIVAAVKRHTGHISKWEYRPPMARHLVALEVRVVFLVHIVPEQQQHGQSENRPRWQKHDWRRHVFTILQQLHTNSANHQSRATGELSMESDSALGWGEWPAHALRFVRPYDDDEERWLSVEIAVQNTPSINTVNKWMYLWLDVYLSPRVLEMYNARIRNIEKSPSKKRPSDKRERTKTRYICIEDYTSYVAK